jgi:hypothetical protein
MEKLEGAVPIIRKIAIITLVGFLVMVLAGPALTVAGILLPFAVVGLLVWIPFKGFMLWKQGGWEAVQHATRKGFGYVFAVPVWILSRVFRGATWILGSVFGLIGFILGLILPTLLGTVGGAILGAIGGMEHQDADFRIPAGAAIGALVGLMAGALRSKRVKTIVVVRHVPERVQHA